VVLFTIINDRFRPSPCGLRPCRSAETDNDLKKGDDKLAASNRDNSRPDCCNILCICHDCWQEPTPRLPRPEVVRYLSTGSVFLIFSDISCLSGAPLEHHHAQSAKPLYRDRPAPHSNGREVVIALANSPGVIVSTSGSLGGVACSSQAKLVSPSFRPVARKNNSVARFIRKNRFLRRKLNPWLSVIRAHWPEGPGEIIRRWAEPPHFVLKTLSCALSESESCDTLLDEE
jgi:hypothetical protein